MFGLKKIIPSFVILLLLVSKISYCQNTIAFDFYGDSIQLQYNQSQYVDFTDSLSKESICHFENQMNQSNFNTVINQLLNYKEKGQLDDWLYYQLIRKTAQYLSPKKENYNRYTLYKWFFLSRSGYDATLKINKNRILFYAQCSENIYEIPCYTKDGKNYVCLNFHDYTGIDFAKDVFTEVPTNNPETQKAFSYKVTHLPQFKPNQYSEKKIEFNYYQADYQFVIKLNPHIQQIFANYPVVDYAYYFNIPISKETYSSLLPALKKTLKRMKQKEGIDYLMRFTRYAFLFESDTKMYGKEKRLSPEQTLMNTYSDCEDRAALFFYLVKEIYNVPMLVLSFPKHITIAVKLDKPVGEPIIYNGVEYSVFEPTPQGEDIEMGKLPNSVAKQPYEIVYSYSPSN